MKLTSSRQRALAALCIALAVTLPLHAAAGGPPAAWAAHAAVDSVDALIVKYRNAPATPSLDTATMGIASAAAARRSVGLRQVRSTALGSHVLRMDRRLSLPDAQALAREIQASDFNVEYAEPDRRLHVLFTPNDPQFAQQWHYFEAAAGINAPAAWDKASGNGVVVAVVDTGVRPHADLRANLVPGFDFISSADEARDGDGRDGDASDAGDFFADNECGLGVPGSSSTWHGTHVAGTVAATTNNAAGVAGVAFGARLQPVRALGRCGGVLSDIADAIRWASGGTVPGVPANPTPARVINLSIGGTGPCGNAFQSAINDARSRGSVVVVAAGNEAQDVANSSPANCSGVIAVAAVGRTGARASYSNFGAGVDLAAPGGDGSDSVASTWNAGTTVPGADTFAFGQGTSMAAPHVSAVAALMLSVNAALTPDQVKARLRASARAVNCTQCGAGLLDAAAAVNAAQGNLPPPPAGNLAEIEPNNTRATAQVITASSASLSGTLSANDVDLFRLTLAPGRTLTAVLAAPATANFDLAIFNVAGFLVVRSSNGAGLIDLVRVTNRGTIDATVFVRASFVGVAAGSAGQQSYTLSLAK